MARTLFLKQLHRLLRLYPAEHAAGADRASTRQFAQPGDALVRGWVAAEAETVASSLTR